MPGQCCSLFNKNSIMRNFIGFKNRTKNKMWDCRLNSVTSEKIFFRDYKLSADLFGYSFTSVPNTDEI